MSFSGTQRSSDKVKPECPYYFEIGFDTGPDHKINDTTGRCWLGMFRNAVVVRGFPVLRRPLTNTGLEMPLHMAAALIGAKRLHSFSSQLCLKGFSAMLTAIRAVEGMVLWHLVYNPTGERVSYLDLSEFAPEPLSINSLRSSRHVIGWCSEALYLAGMCYQTDFLDRIAFSMSDTNPELQVTVLRVTTSEALSFAAPGRNSHSRKSPFRSARLLPEDVSSPLGERTARFIFPRTDTWPCCSG